MRLRISRRWLFSLGTALGILGMLLVVTLAMAQGPEAEGGVEPLANLASKISYQGVLKEDGVPADGDRDMVFALFSDVCSSVAIVEIHQVVPVRHGLFSVELDVPPGAFFGQALWLGVGVDGTTWAGATPVDCREILPVPYALGLKPGAMINSATGSGLSILGNSGNGLYSHTYDGFAVYGQDEGANSARGYGGYFTSQNGIGVYGYSGATEILQNVYTPGVYGKSAYGVGVYGVGGETIPGFRASNDAGVYGESRYGYGVQGTSQYDVGVRGYSASSYGGYFYAASTATAVRAESEAGNPIEAWDNNFPAANDRVFYITNNGHSYIDGNYYGAGGVFAGGADFAEMMLPGERDLMPGDVLVVGPEGWVIRSSEAYEPTVVGVYSTEPGFVGGNKLDEDGNPLEPERIPLAIMGIVPVKASAENGPIQPGDLLAASSTQGHAMRAGADPPAGTVIGKALSPLEEGRGVISALVTLR